MNNRIQEILNAGTQGTDSSSSEFTKISLPLYIDSKMPTYNVSYSTLQSLAFEMGSSSDFSSRRAFQLIIEQISDPEWVQTLKDSFHQYNDLKGLDEKSLRHL
ncbi:MAG: hypothetical protein H6620_12620 [Halobacteriovoraceae bacterium]|nr:hypothetical protein [Halobacteriovoraceae bacterium]